MLRFITIEDQKEALERTVLAIRKTMIAHDYDYKISKFEKYDENLKKLIKDKTEQKVYILDIEMPVVSGLEIASEIRESGDWESMIIFVSAHPECKDDIFYSRLLAIDFISKYFEYEKRLEESLTKVLEIYNMKNALIFNYDYITYRVPIDRILYIEKLTGDKKCLIVTEGKRKYEVTSTLKEIKKKLTPEFYRAHKSCIVNTKKISEIDYVQNTIEFYDKTKINLLSERNKKGLKQYVSQY